MGEYRSEAIDDAKTTAKEFFDEIVESIISETGKTDKVSISDYSDSYHHESHVDKSYNLKDAADLLDDLHEFEETDSGLWEGLDDPREGVKAMAAYTYGNAVASMFEDLMSRVNDEIADADGDTLFFDFDAWLEAKGTPIRKGVLEWQPGVTEEEREDQEEKFREEHEKATLEKVKEIVKEAINNW